MRKGQFWNRGAEGLAVPAVLAVLEAVLEGLAVLEALAGAFRYSRVPISTLLGSSSWLMLIKLATGIS